MYKFVYLLIYICRALHINIPAVDWWAPHEWILYEATPGPELCHPTLKSRPTSVTSCPAFCLPQFVHLDHALLKLLILALLIAMPLVLMQRTSSQLTNSQREGKVTEHDDESGGRGGGDAPHTSRAGSRYRLDIGSEG